MRIYLIGIGMGNPDTATMQAHRAIKESGLIIGAKRMLDAFPDVQARRLDLIKPSEIVEAIQQSTEDVASVLFSGDIGFYSGASHLADKLNGHEVISIAGISSLNYFCSKISTTWQDARLVSAHGRSHNALGEIISHKKTFVITGGDTLAQDICKQLVDCGLGDMKIALGERLSYSDEAIRIDNARNLAEHKACDLAVLMAFNDRPITRQFRSSSLTDAEFIRGDVPMTKEEVRSIVLSKLRVSSDDTVWDVGAGTGSVTIEIALAALQGQVFAIERNQEACALIDQNIEKFNTPNVTVVQGTAPEVLNNLPAPHRVFIGGSGGNLQQIIQVALAKNPDVSFVITAISLDTIVEILNVCKQCNLATDDIIQINVARSKQVGSHHLMMAENPIYIVSTAVN